jgi:hypothetical protein
MNRMMPPWLFALVILVVVCAIGAYIVHKGYAGVPEGFSTASRSAAAACERAFSACLSEGGQNVSCTTAYNTCIANITNSSVSTVDNAASTGRSASSSQAALSSSNLPLTPLPSADYKSLENQALTGKPATLSPELWKFIKDTKGKIPIDSAEYNDLSNLSSLGANTTITPELKTFLEAIKAKSSFEYTKPTASQLDAAQGIDTVTLAKTGSTVVPGSIFNDPAAYKAFQQIVKPHETPTVVTPGLTANQRGADGVQANAILTPSMRQQIRDDVKRAVGEELASIQNEYEITYDNQFESE